jgi:hypothetical protein
MLFPTFSKFVGPSKESVLFSKSSLVPLIVSCGNEMKDWQCGCNSVGRNYLYFKCESLEKCPDLSTWEVDAGGW